MVSRRMYLESRIGRVVPALASKSKHLKLTDRDYNNNGMSDLLAQEGSAMI
jgi:glucosamine-6-phosphate deaminase